MVVPPVGKAASGRVPLTEILVCVLRAARWGGLLGGRQTVVPGDTRVRLPYGLRAPVEPRPLCWTSLLQPPQSPAHFHAAVVHPRACRAPLNMTQATTRPLRSAEQFHPLRWRGSVIWLDSQQGGETDTNLVEILVV